MDYVTYINQKLKKIIAHKSADSPVVCFGQNIDAGSCLGGLTRGLEVKKGQIINSTNSENTLTGMGFGLTMEGVNGIFLMKQQDFLLLGIDHLANTYNYIRSHNPKASFTIVFIIVDLGYQGLQSSLNNVGDFCSIARVDGYTITNKEDIDKILDEKLIAPGFRMIGVSQRLFRTELIEPKLLFSNSEGLFKYKEGADATIVSFNLSFPYAAELRQKLKEEKIDASLFSVSAATPIDWNEIKKDVEKTKKLVVLDDSKSRNLSCDNLLTEMQKECELSEIIVVKKDIDDAKNDWLKPNPDGLKVDYEKIIKKLR